MPIKVEFIENGGRPNPDNEVLATPAVPVVFADYSEDPPRRLLIVSRQDDFGGGIFEIDEAEITPVDEVNHNIRFARDKEPFMHIPPGILQIIPVVNQEGKTGGLFAQSLFHDGTFSSNN